MRQTSASYGCCNGGQERRRRPSKAKPGRRPASCLRRGCLLANARALASSASVFWEVVYDFRELAPVAHASRTSTPRIVERIMRATGGLNIAHNTEDRRPGRGKRGSFWTRQKPGATGNESARLYRLWLPSAGQRLHQGRDHFIERHRILITRNFAQHSLSKSHVQSTVT